MKQIRKKLYRLFFGNAVKEAFDYLPEGVCYFTKDGMLELCNLQMYQLYQMLTEADLQTLEELHRVLAENIQTKRLQSVGRKNEVYRFPDGTVWKYQEQNILAQTQNTYIEVLFFNVSELYQTKQQLDQQKDALEEVARSLKTLSENGWKIAKERERLAVKTRLHDQMGAGLTAIRQQLLQGEPKELFAERLQQFQKTITEMTSETENVYSWEKECNALQEDAAAMGVILHWSGAWPQGEDARELFLLAIKACLINAVRHAKADALYIVFSQEQERYRIQITNNGVPPSEAIVPKGGLANLAQHVQHLGGCMELQWTHVFQLTIILLEGGI